MVWGKEFRQATAFYADVTTNSRNLYLGLSLTAAFSSTVGAWSSQGLCKGPSLSSHCDVSLSGSSFSGLARCSPVLLDIVSFLKCVKFLFYWCLLSCFPVLQNLYPFYSFIIILVRTPRDERLHVCGQAAVFNWKSLNERIISLCWWQIPLLPKPFTAVLFL